MKEHRDHEDKTGRYLEVFPFPVSNNQRLIDGYPRRVLDVPIPLDQSLLASYGPNNLAEGQPISVTNLGSKQPESEKDNALNLD